ncbi:MAG: hypothetical protein KGI75_04170 [Rhizobiaceae bacterium]|nr:hypothetical protein [Rhizobiaceae bacterium]
MPTYEVEMNGQKYEIDAPDDNAVQLAVKQLHDQQGGQNAAPPSNSDALSVARTGVGGFLEGIPVVGPYIRRGTEMAAAGTVAALTDQSYDDVMKRIDAMNAGEKAANPWVDTGSRVAGGVAGTVPMMMAAPAAFGVGAGSLPLRIAASTGTGGVLGGADAAVRSDGDAGQTALGAGIGMGAGFVGPLAGRAVGAGVRWARGATDDALSGISKPAQQYIESTIGDPARMSALQSNLSGLGDQAMLADVSPSWVGVARGAAAQPSMRDQIVNALVERAQGAPARLRSDADQFLGPRVVPSQIEAGLENGRSQFAQLYGPVMADAQGVNTQPLADDLDALATNLRGPARQAVTRVRGYLNVPGETVGGQPVLDPNPQALRATREAIDGLMEGEVNPQVVRQLTAARNQVDDVLADAAPGIKDVDARMHELYRQSEGLQQGRPILSNEAGALRPEEVQQMFVNGSIPQGQMIGPSAEAARMRDSVRGEFDRIVGTKANDATALKNTVRGEGDWNRDKLAYLYGPDNSKGILDAIDREVAFNDTANRVTRGSDTAMTGGFTKFLDETGKPAQIPADTTVTGIGLKGARLVAQSLLRQNAEKAAGKYAQEIGALSVAQGAQRDAIVDALMKRAQQIHAASDPAVQAIINALTQSSARQLLPSR